jgi:metal-dependent amidase/aminoacylase/carboxypeptidase family protein
MRKLFSISLFLLLGINAKCQQNTSNDLIHKSVKSETDNIYEKIVKVRRDFHANPELAGNEKRTQEFIKKYLSDLDIEVRTDFYKHSVVGILKGGKKGKNIAWRADMDALPNDFPDKVAFESTIKGVQHGCGHDVHMAIGLGIAEVLAKNKKSLKGTVYFIFQPEEETFVGAKKMVENGLFTQLKIDEIYGLHITPAPVGQILVKPDEVFAYQRRISIKLKDTLAKEALQKLTIEIKNLFSRNITDNKPWELQHILNPQIGLLSSNTIFKDYSFVDNNYFSTYSKGNQQLIEFYVYETNAVDVSKIIPQVEKKMMESGYQDKLISVSFIQDNPTVMNDKKLTKESFKILENIYGNGTINYTFGQIPFSNDDFAYFQQKVPGVYFFLGGSNFEKGMIAMIHAPNFMVDEECMRVGIKNFSSLLAERLSEN